MNILLVEDNPAAVRLVREAIAECGLEAEVHSVASGEEGLACLRRLDPGGVAVDLVLLDLNLPGLHGREVLAEAKGDPELRHVPIVVLSSSSAPEDVAGAYAAHANSYMVKPTSFDECVTQMRSLVSFWSKTACLPEWPHRRAAASDATGVSS